MTTPIISQHIPYQIDVCRMKVAYDLHQSSDRQPKRHARDECAADHLLLSSLDVEFLKCHVDCIVPVVIDRIVSFIDQSRSSQKVCSEFNVRRRENNGWI